MATTETRQQDEQMDHSIALGDAYARTDHDFALAVAAINTALRSRTKERQLAGQRYGRYVYPGDAARAALAATMARRRRVKQLCRRGAAGQLPPAA